jgi:hypothetical protein
MCSILTAATDTKQGPASDLWTTDLEDLHDLVAVVVNQDEVGLSRIIDFVLQPDA